LSNLGGTLSGLTVNGALDGAKLRSASVTILGGLVLNGTLSLGNAAGTTAGSVTFGTFNTAAGSLTGNGTIVFGGNFNSILNGSGLSGPAATLTIGPSITVRGKSGGFINDADGDTIITQGTIRAE